MAAIGSPVVSSLSLDQHTPAPVPVASYQFEAILREQVDIQVELAEIDVDVEALHGKRAEIIKAFNKELNCYYDAGASFSFYGFIPGFNLPPNATVHEIVATVTALMEQIESRLKEFDRSHLNLRELFEERMNGNCPKAEFDEEIRKFVRLASLFNCPETKPIMDLCKRRKAMLDRKIELKMQFLKARIAVLENGMGCLELRMLQEAITHSINLSEEILPKDLHELEILYLEMKKIVDNVISPASYHRVNGQWQRRAASPASDSEQREESKKSG